MNKFIIKPLQNEHCRQIQELILPIQQLEFNVPVTLEAQSDLFDIETHYHRTGGGFWGAFDETELVGTIALIATGHQAGAIRKMFVKKEYRGREYGIAQSLLEILFVYSKQHQIEDLYLGTVDVLRAAQRFYERNGFQPLPKSALPSYFPVMPVDTLFYHMHLNHD
ncbi:GNAT family N-acetyltransferase [Cytophagaceae bacterium DM2B3-1]|uniref:GNAT family N-acetyltransferase n=1 Tax=Xanthocytophaga flava TaxID=3048013 RepID=A0ABT7CGH1_9BACT|nr:GNAT family N-acetyltransferase [Xanthocytophaga flavus]MDJ1468953.1 GNAT family N-acetyltransferase [Xanthocytophaga flavus]MDJ1492127.1 GNAT family N-acetyltransferase [Xanthocytophaga flavus]